MDEKYEVESLSYLKPVYSLDMLVQDGKIDINDVPPNLLFIISGKNYNPIDNKKYPTYKDWLNELYKNITSILPFDITVYRGISVDISLKYNIGGYNNP